MHGEVCTKNVKEEEMYTCCQVKDSEGDGDRGLGLRAHSGEGAHVPGFRTIRLNS